MASENRFSIVQDLVISDRRLELTKEYCRIHYGFDHYRLDPRMVVIHYTAFPTFDESFAFLKPDELSLIRGDIRAGGTVNVGSHYLIDRDGAIHQLIPDDVVARHTIGFNHAALSFENVGRDKDHLTEAQVDADAFLIDRLKRNYPGLEYVIGHYEYMDRRLPHFSLFRENDSGYRFTDKQDPGAAFMEALRARLLERYGLKFSN